MGGSLHCIIIIKSSCYTTGIKISNDTKLNTILFADDQVVIANSEDNLQRGLHSLHQTVQTFGMRISHQ
jgi:hypothetical protein